MATGRAATTSSPMVHGIDEDATKNEFTILLQQHKVQHLSSLPALAHSNGNCLVQEHFDSMSRNFGRKFAAMRHEIKLSKTNLSKCAVHQTPRSFTALTAF